MRLDTAGHDEDVALALLAPLLDDAGFDVALIPWHPGRSNLVASWRGGGPLVLSGHVDTVPVGAAAWAAHPLGGDVDGDRLHGRGASDMKGGVAAMTVAALDAAAADAAPFRLVFTSGEETGCGGGAAVAAAGRFPADGILIVGESTGNDVRLGHKGATWLRLDASGRGAHGSRPELGENAIEKLADAMRALGALPPRPPHPQLGSRTTNIGTIAGGTQTNLVPDAASMTVDVRTVPGAGAEEVTSLLEIYGTVTPTLDIPAVWSDPTAELTDKIVEVVASVRGSRASMDGVSYFTDAAVLDPTRARSYIVGPGDPDQPHTTDESVSVRMLSEAVEIYRALIGARLA
ncbi:M20/M25/M40 family metallo-hydrolase [Microbacterium trichothecenolyticum]|uniref:M20/M25/M40 family metallo-hydrolase n=1 Tax=Microbacterium trichothecenolyticum TaxID=69370 RepID=UPI0027D7CE3F|nr:M20/M25/M40 family metallo-hydrolase [Microbacterium trichothecenolyticum]